MADYCTPSQVKSELDITDNQYDIRIAGYIDSASRWIDRHCMYGDIDSAFNVQVDSTRYYDWHSLSGKELRLDMPIVTVTSITNGDGTTVSSADYRLLPRNSGRYRRIMLLSTDDWDFSDIDSEIAVVGKFGYSTNTPEPVREACTWLSAWLFQRYQSGLNATSAIVDLGQIQNNEVLPETAMLMLEPFVNRSEMYI